MAERDAVRPVHPGPPIGPSEPPGAPCASIEDQINNLELDIAGLQGDLIDAPPKYKPVFEQLIAKDKAELSSLRYQLAQCSQSNLPDLFLAGVNYQLDRSTSELGVSAVIGNQGGGTCDQSFQVAIGIAVEELSTGQNLPIDYPLDPGAQIATGYTHGPLRFIDHDSAAHYTFYFVIDPDFVVAESNKANNQVTLTNQTFFSTEVTAQQGQFDLNIAAIAEHAH